MPRSFEALDKALEDEQNSSSNNNSYPIAKSAGVGVPEGQQQPHIAIAAPSTPRGVSSSTSTNRPTASGSRNAAPLLFSPPGGRGAAAAAKSSADDLANGTAGGASYFAAPPAYSHTTQVPVAGTRRDSLLGGNDSLLAPNPDNVSYSSSEAEVNSSNQPYARKRKGRGRLGDGNPLPAQELSDTPNVSSSVSPHTSNRRHSNFDGGNERDQRSHTMSPGRSSQQQQQTQKLPYVDHPVDFNNVSFGSSGQGGSRSSPRGSAQNGAPSYDPIVDEGAQNNAYNAPTTEGTMGGPSASNDFSTNNNNNTINNSSRGGYSRRANDSPNGRSGGARQSGVTTPASPTMRGQGMGGSTSPRQDGKRASNNLSRQTSHLFPNASMAGLSGGGGGGGGSLRNSTRYSRRGESNLGGYNGGGGGGGGGADPSQSPRVSFVNTIRDVGEQFVDIVRNKSKRHLRSHDELTMSPFQKFIHYGRFPCKLVLSTLIVILITVLIFTFELPNSLNDENERKQLIELFMDAIEVDGASGRREPGEDYTFVPKLFLSTQESVLAAMANVGQLYYNITRESLCDVDFFFNDEYDDFPRNVTVDGFGFHYSHHQAADSSSDLTTTRRWLLSDEQKTDEGDSSKAQGKYSAPYARDRLLRNRQRHPKLKNLVNSDSIASDLPEEMRPENILSDLMRESYNTQLAEKGRSRNRDGRIPNYKGGARSLDEMGERAVGRFSGKRKRAQMSSPFGRFFSKDALVQESMTRKDGESVSSESDPLSLSPPPAPRGGASDGGRGVQRVYFPAMRASSAAPPQLPPPNANLPSSSERFFSAAGSGVVGEPKTHHFGTYYDYVRYLFLSGQIADPFFINSTWVQPPTLTVKFMRSSPRVDWAAADSPTREESFAVTLDNLLGPFILAPDAGDGRSEPNQNDSLPVWSFHICAPREDPLFEGHFFLPCRDSIDQDANETAEAVRRGERVRLTSRRRLPGSPSALAKFGSARRGFAGASSSSPSSPSKRASRRSRRAAKYYKSLAAGSSTSLSEDAAVGGKKSLQNALARRRASSSSSSSFYSRRSGFSAAAVDGDADRLFTPFGIFDTTDDAVIDMYIHQLFTASNSKNPQFSDLFYQDSIYIWHVRVFFDLDTNGLATVTVEVDNQVRRNHSSFQTIFFLLILLLLFAVWDAILRIRGLRSVLHLKRMIRKRLESLRREQVRRAWAKAREHEESAFAPGGVQKLFSSSRMAAKHGSRESLTGANTYDSINNLTAQLLGDDSTHHEDESRKAQAARHGGLLSAPGGAAGYVSPTAPSPRSDTDNDTANEHASLIGASSTGVAKDNLYADHNQAKHTASSSSSSRPTSLSTFRTRFTRAWRDLFGIVDDNHKRDIAAANMAAAKGPSNPNAFIHPITQKVLTDHELQQLERKCRKSLKSDAGMSWQFLAIICDFLSAVYVCFAVAQATSLTVSSSAVRVERIILGIAGLFSSVLLVSYLRFFPKFYFMIRATSAALPRVILFYIGVLPIFFAFSIFWVTVFGSYSKGQFDSLTRSIATLYCCMFGDNLLPTFQAAMNNDSYEIYFLAAFVTFAFIAFFMFAVLNLTMSIVMDSFDNVKEKYGLRVDDPSQQYLQYGSKGVMAMKAAEQKQIEAVRVIREQLGVIAKTLPIMNGGKSKRTERRNKAKDKAKQKQQQQHHGGGSNINSNNQSFANNNNNTNNQQGNNRTTLSSGRIATNSGRNVFEEDSSPPHLSISAGETRPLFREREGRLMPPTGAPQTTSANTTANTNNNSPSTRGSNSRVAGRSSPMQFGGNSQRSAATDEYYDGEDYDDEYFDDMDLDDEDPALGESEATKATKARFESKYHEFMMEPGLDGDVLSHLQVNYDERDECDENEASASATASVNRDHHYRRRE